MTLGSPLTVSANWVSTAVFCVSVGTTRNSEGILSGPSWDSVAVSPPNSRLALSTEQAMSQYSTRSTSVDCSRLSWMSWIWSAVASLLT